MIRFGDALILAGTKLRTHKVRTAITIVISSLLFAALIAAFVISTGITRSMVTFNKQGLNSRYFTVATPVHTLPNGWSQTPDFLSYVQQHYQHYIDEKAAEAKKLGVAYDPKTAPSPIVVQQIPGQGTTTRVNFGAPEVFSLMLQYQREHPNPGLTELKQAAAPYHPASVATDFMVGLNGMTLMPDGKEVFDPTDEQVKQLGFLQNQTPPSIIDGAVTKPFLFPGTKVNHNDIPLVVSYKTAQHFLGLASLPSDAGYQQKIDRLEELYKKAQNLTVTVCYRNTTSANQIQTAIQQATDFANNKNSKDYQKPDLIYGLPDPSSCGPAPILGDTRTAAEKKQQAAQDQLDREFGQNGAGEPSEQQLITFQIVGLAPNTNMDSSLTFGDLLSSITGSSLGADIVIPRDLLGQMNDGLPKQLIDSQLDGTSDAGSANLNMYLVEFTNPRDARRFIKEQGCVNTVDGNACENGDKKFGINDWANNNLAITDLTNKITFVLEIATAAVTLLAIVILTTMVGRTVADGRKETAVFRALGAKRGDITLIYTLYTLYLVAIIAIVSLVVGLGVAYAIQIMYEHQATLMAKLLFDAVNTNLSFTFFSIDYRLLALAVGVIVVTGLLSMILPLLRNVPRSPIRDMREE